MLLMAHVALNNHAGINNRPLQRTASTDVGEIQEGWYLDTGTRLAR